MKIVVNLGATGRSIESIESCVSGRSVFAHCSIDVCLVHVRKLDTCCFTSISFVTRTPC